MTEAGDAGSSAPSPKPPAGWYPDPWTPSRRRYWNGSSWTFSTTDAARFDDPAPEDATPLREGHRLPDPVYRPPAAATADGRATSARPPQRPIKWVLAVVVGLVVGLVGVALSTRSSSRSTPSTSGSAAPTTAPGAAPTSLPPTSSVVNNDPSAPALASLIVNQADVPSSATVVVLPGGIGLAQPTLDLCNGTYPSESRRTARIQNAVVEAQGVVTLSTEAVLYGDSGGTTQAFGELRAVTEACPPTPVQGASGGPPITTRFNPPPDADWPRTPTVNRLAYDFTSHDGTSPPRHSVAVYLQRGRVLLGVYFVRAEGPQTPVEGQTTIEGIVGIFAARVAALPASVVGT
ncbi:MAG: DUF2510 domain-containing protein [Actinomycetota bacterium]|nr:DUF2510 domain-containing protein [Actinomycetota bacterium]